MQRVPRLDNLRFVGRIIVNPVLLEHWMSWVQRRREFLLYENHLERFFTCLVYSADYWESKPEQVEFFRFLLLYFEKDIQPSLLWMFIRHQPKMVREIVRIDKTVL